MEDYLSTSTRLLRHIKIITSRPHRSENGRVHSAPYCNMSKTDMMNVIRRKLAPLTRAGQNRDEMNFARSREIASSQSDRLMQLRLKTCEIDRNCFPGTWFRH